MSKRKQAWRSLSANECPTGIYAEGILLDAPRIQTPPFGGVFIYAVQFLYRFHLGCHGHQFPQNEYHPHHATTQSPELLH